MRTPTIIRSFLFRHAPVAPLPEKSRFTCELTAELDTLGGEVGLVQLLDSTIATQKIALDSLVKISDRDDYDRCDVDKYLEDNIEILDVCNFFVEKIENINKYVDPLKKVVHLVDNNNVCDKPNKFATKRALELLESSSSCYQSVEKRSCKGLKKLLRQRLCHHHETNHVSEIMCGSKVMSLICLRFLEIGFAFDTKNGKLPKMKVLSKSQITSYSWLRLLHELAEEVEASVDEKKGKKKRSSLLKDIVDASKELKEKMKEEKEMKYCVERLKGKCEEFEDMIEVVEERVKDLYRSLIDVRMSLLGIVSKSCIL